MNITISAEISNNSFTNLITTNGSVFKTNSLTASKTKLIFSNNRFINGAIQTVYKVFSETYRPDSFLINKNSTY